ncbi:MAG: FG-GAP-like repeat-containing protein [Pyrinomonadaceae bacterium]
MKRNLILSILLLCAMTASTAVFAFAADKSSEANVPAASTTLVLSQVYGGGGGSTGTYLNDYVEIKNISATPQSLNGLSIQYGSAVGNFGSSATNIFALPNVTLAPGQYYLVQLGAAGTAGAPLPVAADATTTNLSMSASSGKVALANIITTLNCGATATPCTFPNANIIDWVAYGAAGNGTAGNGEGGTSVNNGSALTSSQGAVRKTGGCTDTDDNNADFDVITAPVPRNSASPAVPCGGTAVTLQHVVDYDGDGKTDWSVVRNTGGGPSGQVTWFNQFNGSAGGSTVAFGLAADHFVPADYDGDSRTDISVWRPGASGTAAWYTLLSGTNTLRSENFGQTGDDPTVVGDYNGDGKADIAVYRAGATTGLQSTWYYRTVVNGPTFVVNWGTNGDFPAPGDYDGDHKNDFVIQRNDGGGSARFWTLFATGTTKTERFGTPTDVIVPGDYDGDGKTDIATIRSSGGQILWLYDPSSTPAEDYTGTTFGNSATDFVVQGDYDGDGKTDFAVWRPNADPTMTYYYVNRSNGSGLLVFEWGQNGDYPVANYNTHSSR